VKAWSLAMDAHDYLPEQRRRAQSPSTFLLSVKSVVNFPGELHRRLRGKDVENEDEDDSMAGQKE
jgi:hypothetical protein